MQNNAYIKFNRNIPQKVLYKLSYSCVRYDILTVVTMGFEAV